MTEKVLQILGFDDIFGKFAEHCRRRKFLVLVEEEVAAGDSNAYKLAKFLVSPDDGEGDADVNI